jgi:hypothetical protein
VSQPAAVIAITAESSASRTLVRERVAITQGWQP